MRQTESKDLSLRRCASARLRQVKVLGLKRVDWFYRLTMAACNLMWMRRLIPIEALARQGQNETREPRQNKAEKRKNPPRSCNEAGNGSLSAASAPVP
jgi:hypothetical protein